MSFLAEFDLELWKSDGQDISKYPTSDNKLNHAVQHKLRSDNLITRILSYFAVDDQVFDHQLWVSLTPTQQIDHDTLDQILYSATPNEGGPDGWMEGDLSLPEPYAEYELVPILRRMWIAQNNQWVQLDLHSFYPDSYP